MFSKAHFWIPKRCIVVLNIVFYLVLLWFYHIYFIHVTWNCGICLSNSNKYVSNNSLISKYEHCTCIWHKSKTYIYLGKAVEAELGATEHEIALSWAINPPPPFTPGSQFMPIWPYLRLQLYYLRWIFIYTQALDKVIIFTWNAKIVQF